MEKEKGFQMIGEVIIHEVDGTGWYFTYGDVTNSTEDLVDTLEKYCGKKVRVTVEVLEDDEDE